MSYVESLTLGVVQGLTEFLPISSSAHLRVVPALLGWADPGAAYSAVIQLGSVIAVIAYFAKDLLKIFTGTIAGLKEKDFDREELRTAGAIIVGTLPVCILGLLLKHHIEDPNGPFRSLITIGCSAIGMALLLGFAEAIGKRQRTIHSVGGRDGLIVGLGQAMALIPGCSRSGSTLTAALFINLTREDGARFSFLLGIPAIILSGLVELKDMLQQHGLAGAAMGELAVGLVAATVVSYACIAWLLKYLQTHSTIVFIIYRLIFGIAVIALATKHMIH